MRPADLRTTADASAVRSTSELADRLARLPDGHPSKLARPSDGPRDVRRLTDAEHAGHVADVRIRLADAAATGIDTRVLYTIDRKHEIWSDERDARHDALIDRLYAQSASVPGDHRAVLAGGLPGAGKTTVLTEHAGLDLSSYLVINPDLIKEEMARGMLLPQVRGLSPMESSMLAHEEASHLAKRLAHRAQAEGKNIVWDMTMSRTGTCTDRIAALRAHGYTQIDAVFVDIPIAVSLGRADARHREGHDDFRAGAGLGGRFVFREMILAHADKDWGSVNRANFERVKDLCDAWSRYDNSADGRPARLVAAGSRDSAVTRRAAG
ncbi:MAG TPA: AAA family ATPase [Streptosporangiaceae bacterium]